jgi:hypothetical protein
LPFFAWVVVDTIAIFAQNGVVPAGQAVSSSGIEGIAEVANWQTVAIVEVGAIAAVIFNEDARP